ncbi:hypothetical protein MTO96_045760, partial [Rhipicephalus appendiculatus]
ASYPATFSNFLPRVPLPISHLGTIFRLSWPSPPRGRVHTVATWTVLDLADRPVAWTSRLPWRLQPRPLDGDPPFDTPKPFRGLLSDWHPTEPPQLHMTEETRILCPICRVPDISRRTHQDGSLPAAASL